MSVARTIVCFSWNASGLKFCKSLSPRGWLSTTLTKPCLAPDFANQVFSSIDENVRFAAFSTEDEDESNTYFHSDYLPTTMKAKGMVLYQGLKLAGVGDIAAGAAVTKGFFHDSTKAISTDSLLIGDDIELVKASGVPSNGALRLSVYCQAAELPLLTDYRKATEGAGYKSKTSLVNKALAGTAMGAIAIEAIMDQIPIAFIAVSLGFNKTTAADLSQPLGTKFLQDFGKKINTDFGIVDTSRLAFLMGDFNTNITQGFNTTLATMKNGDTLSSLLKNTIFEKYQEGMGNKGVTFSPTWRRKRGQGACAPSAGGSVVISKQCYNPFSDAVALSYGWHDRILYNVEDQLPKVTCTYYNSICDNNCKYSSHAAVFGKFTIESLEEVQEAQQVAAATQQVKPAQQVKATQQAKAANI